MSGESIPVQRIRGVIYARFSCGHQNEKSIEGQVEDCKAFAREQGVEIVNVYVDRAMTATNDRRPAFQKMILDSRAHLFETVVVWKSDRFSRNTADAPRYRKELEENGVSLLSVTEPNIEGPERILFNAMNDGYNAYYSAELSVKIKRGNRINVEKGIFNGGRIPYGYDDVDQRLAINPKEADVVKEIFREYSSSGITLNALRVALKARGIRNRSGNPFSHGSLYNMLRNRTYLGEYTKGGATNPKAFPAIVNAEVFAKASSRLKENAKKSTSFRSEETDTFLLTGKLCCAKCGALMVGDSGKVRSGKPAFKYYACHNRKRRKDCDMKPVRKELIEDYVVSETSKWVNDSGFLDAFADAVYSL
jgi:DNA invertase Pin-like site-specific DNA recombinase